MALLGFTLGCFDVVVPADIGGRITCADVEDCPEGLRCLETGGGPRCFGLDVEPPRIDAVTIEPLVAAGDDVVTVTVSADAPARLLVGGDETEVAAVDGVFSFPVADQPEGALVVRVVAERDGLVATASASVVVDKTAPALVDATLSRAAVNAGEVFLVVVADDPLLVPPLLSFAGDTAPPFESVGGSGTSWTFVLRVTPDVVEGTFGLVSVVLEDAVGNRASSEVTGVSLVVDRTAPDVSELVATPATISLIEGFDAGLLSFVVDDADANVAVRLSGVPLSCVRAGLGYSCPFSAADVAADASRDLIATVLADDAAGNSNGDDGGIDAVDIAVDVDPPAFLGDARVSIEGPPPGAGFVPILGGNHSVIIDGVFTEPVAPNVVVTTGCGLVAGAVALDDGRLMSATLTRAADAVNGLCTIVVIATDLVGNTLEEQLFVASYDVDVPTSGKATLVRAPWGVAPNPLGGNLVDPEPSTTLLLTDLDPGSAVDVHDIDGALLVSSAPSAERTASVGLGSLDRSAVRWSVRDSAGNATPLQTIVDTRYIAGFGGKIAGRATPNPHTLVARARFLPILDDDEVELGSEGILGGLVVRVQASPVWESLDAAGLSITGASSVGGVDVGRGELVLRSLTVEHRDSDGILQPVSVDQGEFDQPRDAAALVWDEAHDELVVVERDATRWARRLAGFVRLTDPPVIALPDVLAAAWDRQTDTVVFVAGTDGAVRLFRQLDRGWVEVVTSGATPAGSGKVAIVDDGAGGMLLVTDAAHRLVDDTWQRVADPPQPPSLPCSVTFDRTAGAVAMIAGIDTLARFVDGVWVNDREAIGSSGSLCLAWDGRREGLVAFSEAGERLDIGTGEPLRTIEASVIAPELIGELFHDATTGALIGLSFNDDLNFGSASWMSPGLDLLNPGERLVRLDGRVAILRVDEIGFAFDGTVRTARGTPPNSRFAWEANLQQVVGFSVGGDQTLVLDDGSESWRLVDEIGARGRRGPFEAQDGSVVQIAGNFFERWNGDGWDIVGVAPSDEVLVDGELGLFTISADRREVARAELNGLVGQATRLFSIRDPDGVAPSLFGESFSGAVLDPLRQEVLAVVGAGDVFTRNLRLSLKPLRAGVVARFDVADVAGTPSAVTIVVGPSDGDDLEVQVWDGSGFVVVGVVERGARDDVSVVVTDPLLLRRIFRADGTVVVAVASAERAFPWEASALQFTGLELRVDSTSGP